MAKKKIYRRLLILFIVSVLFGLAFSCLKRDIPSAYHFSFGWIGALTTQFILELIIERRK